MAGNLEPLEPGEAMALYIESREDELAERSLELHEKHLQKFVNWCSENGIRNLNEVTARTIHEYKLYLKKQYASSTVSTHLTTVKMFIQFCESIDGVAGGTGEKIDLPPRDDNARDEKLDPDDAEEILSYLRKFHYGSRSHALMELLWHSGLRTGTIRSLDVKDLDEERDRLRIRHRPETGTPLKNKEKAERYVALSPEVAEVLGDYISEHRHTVTDDYGRHPLFTTKNGRPVKNSIRRNIYAITRPCARGEACPHGENPETCVAAGRTNDACKCPSTLSGHPVRRGAITHFLRKDVPERVVSDRMNVSRQVLNKHYDRRTESEKAEQRRSFLDNL